MKTLTISFFPLQKTTKFEKRALKKEKIPFLMGSIK